MQTKSFSSAIFLFLTALSPAVLAQNDYTVEPRGGVPFMHVNGKPVRGKMFYGNVPGMKYDSIDENWKRVALKFTAKRDCDACLQMNFGSTIRDIEISEIVLTDDETGEKLPIFDFSDASASQLKSNWTQKSLEAWRDIAETVSDTAPDPKKYPVPPFTAENKNGVLHIRKDFVSKEKIQSKIHDIERLNFIIDSIKLKEGKSYSLSMKLRSDTEGRFEVSVFYESPRELAATNTGETFMTQEKYAASVGVDFVTFGVPAFWEDDETCKKLVDSRFQPVIAANPNAKIIVRLGLEPPNWWLDSHKDDLMCSPDGVPIERMHVRFPSPSSENYRRDALNAMRKFIKYAEEKYPDNIAGYHPSGGNSSEWFYGGTYEKGHHGYDKATLAAWRKWLAKKYVTDAGLQKAWNRPNVRIAEAAVPSVEERFASDGAILDPQTRMPSIDFNIFLQDEMSDIVLLAAETIRKTAPRKRLSVIFYGYGFGFSSVPKGPAYSGHYAFGKLLKSDAIDIFTAPIAYHDRNFGGIKCCVSPAESASLHGKIWLDEDDNRTWLAPKSGSPPYVLDFSQRSRAESTLVMRRNMAHQSIKNLGSWWMDLFGCGWFLDRQLWGVFDEFKEVESDLRNNPSPYSPETAVSYDEISMCHVSGKPHSQLTTANCIMNLPKYLATIGTPHGQYLLEDILEGRARPKLHYISGAYALDKKQRKQMRNAAENMACVYLWNAGYADTDNRNLSLDAIEEATGFKVEYAGKTTALAIPTKEGKREGIGNFGFNLEVSPLFSPVPEEGDKVIATYPNGKPAMVVRTGGKFPQIFIGVTKLSPEVCKYIAKICGIHSYVDNEAVAVANGSYLSINATKDGRHTISLKDEADVFDVLENKPIGRFKTRKFNLKKGDVKLFKLSK